MFGVTPRGDSITDRNVRARIALLAIDPAVEKDKRQLRIEAICDGIYAKQGRFREARLILTGKRGTLTAIILAVARKHDVTSDDIMAQGRFRFVVEARHEAFYWAATRTNKSLSEIGRRMGGFDHTTVIHGIRRHIERTGAPSVRGLGPAHAKGA